ncbi:LacI family DNA-binding transcriptional regulator [Mesorhizobium sp. IMUNJ 23232]|uniref:LacI family DNA-binding transcriptional regulator n=1 Tax=Mesorhizobium sp. IMUNJ 23232 TaxID=3376064 RepID=UPI00379F1E33
MKDIAVTTGYSANTVSLALRGSPRIPEETRDRIQSAARSLNYFPNTIAQALVSRETRTIGLILTDIMNPTLTLVSRFLEKELAQRGYALMLAASDHDSSKEVSALDVFRSRQVDGILIYPTNHNRLDHIRAVRQAGYPALVLADIPFAGLDVVAIDDRSGAYKAVRHLIERGHRRIAMLDAAQLVRNSEKHDGAVRAIAEAGLPAEALIVIKPDGHTATDGFRAIGEAMKAEWRPTALFATTDSLAIGVLRWCREQGVSVPGDLAIVGYDNTEAADFSSVPMTSIDYAAAEVSRHAVDRILSLIGKTSPPAPIVTLIDPEIVVRQSS